MELPLLFAGDGLEGGGGGGVLMTGVERLGVTGVAVAAGVDSVCFGLDADCVDVDLGFVFDLEDDVVDDDFLPLEVWCAVDDVPAGDRLAGVFGFVGVALGAAPPAAVPASAVEPLDAAGRRAAGVADDVFDGCEVIMNVTTVTSAATATKMPTAANSTRRRSAGRSARLPRARRIRD